MRKESAGPGLLSILLGAVAAGPLLLYGLSATSEAIITDLGISEAQFGLLATICFACAAVGNATLGRLADRRSDLTLMTAVFLIAALALGLAGVPGGYPVLLIAAGLSGVAQSFTNGVTNRILLERVPASKRIGWVGVKQSGVQVSQLVASLSFPLLAVLVGWRGTALLTALLPLLLLVLTWRILRTVPLLHPTRDAEPSSNASTSGSSETSGRPNASAQSPAAPRGHSAAVWALAAFGCLNGIGVQATNVYLPLFAVRELDFSLILGGATAAVAGVVGVTARIGWARVMARGASGPLLLLILALTALAGVGAFLGADATGWAALLWTAVVLHGASALGVSVVLMSVLLRSIPSAKMASSSGVVTAGMFAGFAIGPLGMGLLISSGGGFTLGWMAVGVVYLLSTLLAVILVSRRRRPGSR
ncbi:MFS transporter [Nesterenkonia sp. E16_7]|uniref:MFS transporter n=1 Tax=unclassified Nesterenkonia TaxID=2629769 RepID=UPI001A91E963|nr:MULTISPECIES: MFS transporter [unclassified Nesterenkonia]MBO0594680.1 MFS transporter [Nesterenkonia sp. E16_10]MBO0597429.1 MFS transporter [Nesterenkonia sp. E16_7]